jgi:NAD(P)-dependent dehydrogenase (short-subunit alcohol dehydrogenase family)
MGRKALSLSRRAALSAALCAAAGGIVRQAFGQPASSRRSPQDQTRWAGMGVRLQGTTALVTGSTDGLGREVARQLGALGAFVIVHGRNAERGDEVVRMIRAAGPGDAVFYRADFSALAEVRAFADQMMDRHRDLKLLINNAAASGGGGGRRTSTDGHELAFAVNYLSHFLLTHHLLPVLDDNAPARIVNVSSMGQTAIDFDDVMMERQYNGGDAYRRSKLAQIMFTMDLAKMLDPARITITSVHPARSMNTQRVIRGGSEPLSTVEEGAEAVMQLAVSPEVARVTGVYFNQLAEARAHAQAYDDDARAKLWALSMELTGIEKYNTT